MPDQFARVTRGNEPDYPVAVLVGRDGHERVIRTTEPPPPTYRVVIHQPLSVHPSPEPPRYESLRVRTFLLSNKFRSRDHWWWRVYNEGRSMTPENGYVYLEQPEADPAVGQPADSPT